nr:helix-turn-helix domain-containing protein [Devosia sp.]
MLRWRQYAGPADTWSNAAVSSSGANLRDRASDITVGERTLPRRSQQHFGYGPKTLERVLRVQRFLRGARDPRPNRLAAMALNAGYADQAHMNREVKALTTLTPLCCHGSMVQVARWLSQSTVFPGRRRFDFIGPKGTNWPHGRTNRTCRRTPSSKEAAR